MKNANQYDSRDIYNEIVKALKAEDVTTLLECDQELKDHNDEHVLLMLYPAEYEKYHELLRKTSISHEVEGRSAEGLV